MRVTNSIELEGKIDLLERLLSKRELSKRSVEFKLLSIRKKLKLLIGSGY